MNHDDKPTTHPSFGTIYVGRVSGHTHLFQSDFTHHHYISLKISTAVEYPSYGVDNRVHDKEEIVEINMSESQWARLISSMNMGGGVPCTLDVVRTPPSIKEYEGKRIPRLEPKDVRQTHKDKVKADIQARMAELEAVVQQLRDWRAASKRPTLAELDELISCIQSLHLANNFAFMQQLLEEKMEVTIDEARTEIEAQMNSVIQQLGMEALKERLPEIPHQKVIETDGSK